MDRAVGGRRKPHFALAHREVTSQSARTDPALVSPRISMGQSGSVDMCFSLLEPGQEGLRRRSASRPRTLQEAMSRSRVTRHGDRLVFGIFALK